MRKIDITSNIKPKKNNDLNILTSGAFAAPLLEILKSYKNNKSIIFLQCNIYILLYKTIKIQVRKTI